jgi:predicted nucleic acid-binding protein
VGAAPEANPAPVRNVVCDTGPLLHLAEAGRLDLLRRTGSLYVPAAVWAELEEYAVEWISRLQELVQEVTLDGSHRSAADAWRKAGLLHRGEAEAIELARQLHAEWFLTDDAAARLVAESSGLEAHGSLGVVLWAAAAGHVTRVDAESALDSLASSSLWISASVLAEARDALKLLARE